MIALTTCICALLPSEAWPFRVQDVQSSEADRRARREQLAVFEAQVRSARHRAQAAQEQLTHIQHEVGAAQNEVQELQAMQEQLRLTVAAENDWKGAKRNKRLLTCIVGSTSSDQVR